METVCQWLRERMATPSCPTGAGSLGMTGAPMRTPRIFRTGMFDLISLLKEKQ